MYLYVIRDKVSQQSGFIMEAKNNGVAMRNFQRTIDSDPSLNPEEFSLWKIGEWDHEEDKGEFYNTIEKVIISVEDEDE